MYDALVSGGGVLSQGFGCTGFGLEPNCGTGCPHWHTGIDIAAAAGTPVRAVGYGRVVKVGSVGTSCGSSCGGGNFGPYAVSVLFGDKVALYGHLSAATVAEGQSVTPDQVVGHVGTCGCSTGPHLHYEIDPANCACAVSDCCCQAVDPGPYLSSWPGSQPPGPVTICPPGVPVVGGICQPAPAPAPIPPPVASALWALLLGGGVLLAAGALAERESPGILRREWGEVRAEATRLLPR